MKQGNIDSIVERGPYRVQSSPKAMVNFALGSSCLVATLLCIPDAIGILPSCAKAAVWSIRVAGLWPSAYILWTLGFLGVLFLMRTISGGIEIRPEGLKLWRCDGVTPWDSIEALVCEPQPLFKRLCFLKGDVYKLTIYREKKNLLTGGMHLVTLSIPSFQLDSSEFRSLLVFISQKCFNATPSDMHCAFFNYSASPDLAKQSKQGKFLRVAASCMILFSLLMFLGRRTAVNYSFNLGNVEFQHGQYMMAASKYAMAAAIDPFFAPAWDRLARCEVRQGLTEEAEIHWKIALQRKPDFVEAKIGLSLISMNRGELNEAKRLLESAVRLAPTSIPAYINLAQLYLLRDEPLKASV